MAQSKFKIWCSKMPHQNVKWRNTSHRYLYIVSLFICSVSLKCRIHKQSCSNQRKMCLFSDCVCFKTNSNFAGEVHVLSEVLFKRSFIMQYKKSLKCWILHIKNTFVSWTLCFRMIYFSMFSWHFFWFIWIFTSFHVQSLLKHKSDFYSQFFSTHSTQIEYFFTIK